MDSFILRSWTRALILAAGLSIVSAAAVSAQTAAPAPSSVFISVPLGTAATIPLSSWYQNPPTGSVLGGVPFSLGNFTLLFQGQSTVLPTSVPHPAAVYLLLNTANTFAAYAGQTAGMVRLSFSDGTFQDTALVVGANVREWEFGLNWTANSLTSPAAVNVFTGLAQPGFGGATAGIDMLEIPIASRAASLTGVTVSNTAAHDTPWMTVRGVTVSDASATADNEDEDEDEAIDDGDDQDGQNPAAPAATVETKHHDTAKAAEQKQQEKGPQQGTEKDEEHVDD